MLDASAISQEVRAERGYRTVTVKAELKQIGFTARQARVPALLIPLYDVHGETAGYQVRPDEPRIDSRGKVVKYETPRGSRMVLDVPPPCRPMLGDPSVPLFVTEGVKKADAAASFGLCCVGLIGVWNWRGRNEHGGLTALAAWDSIALNDRQTHIVFDSDVMTKPAVHTALVRLKGYLEGRKAKVAVVYLPSGEGCAKVGMDDYFAAGHGVDDLLRHASTEVLRPDVEDAGPYEFSEDGIYLRTPTSQGVDRIRLTNFTAQITCETTLDDGLEQYRVFRLEGAIAGHTAEFDVSAREFEDMRWPTEHIGRGATLFPERNVERHVRTAIQTTSGVSARQHRVYLHAGWIRRGGEYLFLHAGGALGAAGAVEAVEVRLDGRLGEFSFPSAAGSADIQVAVAAVLELLDLGPHHIMVPLVAASLRVVLATCDFSVHLVGASGAFKTAVAALCQQFFGPRLDARNLPGSWLSTGNALEALSFYAKDVVLVVDDFAPSGGRTATSNLHQTAERLLRAQGNKAGRGRCAPDGTLRPTRSPRGLILSTGEETPRGASLRARFLTLELRPGDIDVATLGLAQRQAAEGKFALALAAFIRWLAPRLDAVRAALPGRVEALRHDFGRDGRHRRFPGLAADLYVGIETFAEFAVAEGHLDSNRADSLMTAALDGLRQAVAAQEREQREADPATRFLDLLRSALACGGAHITDPFGITPSSRPEAWGWHAQSVERDPHSGDRGTWRAGGLHVGWLSENDLYLDKEAALKAAQSVGNDTGDPISIVAATLSRRLRDGGHLASTDPDGTHIEVQRTLSGSKRRVLHLRAHDVMPAGNEPELDA